MNALKDIWTYLLVCSLVVILQPLEAFSQNSDAAKTGSKPAVRQRDGQHDFDFEMENSPKAPPASLNWLHCLG